MSHISTDAEKLAALGYESEFKRDMSPWANFALGFTYLSPVVGVYTVFAYALSSGGPPMIWTLLIVGLGQFLVALIFSEVVAQFPVAGGVYPWARRLWGKKYAWMTGWVYLIALLVTIASVAYGAGPFIAEVFGYTPSASNIIYGGIVVVALALVINFMGTKIVSAAAVFGFAAELIGALAVGIWLLTTHRHVGLGAIFHSYGASQGHYFSGFAAAALIGLWQYYGFEACGDVAEEVPNPGRMIPKAMRRTIYIGGSAATFVCLALILSVQNIGAVISGEDADPVGTLLNDAFGSVGARIVLCVVLISFLSCTTSLQAAASRLAYAYGRDDMIVGSRFLKKFDAKRAIPPYALALSGVVPVLVVLISKFSTDAFGKILNFSALGIYIAFQMVVLAALRARLKGWNPSGEYTLGKWGIPVNVAALAYGIVAMIDMVWPRTPGTPWYDNYIVLVSGVAVIVVGLIYMVIHPAHGHSDAPYDDAIPKQQARAVLGEA